MQIRIAFIFVALSISGSVVLAPASAAQDLEAVRIKDVNCRPAGKGADPDWLTPAGSLLFFAAYTELGVELWASDGTLAGTYLVKDIAPRNSSDPSSLVALGDTVFFAASEGTERELWKSDGTELGTVRVSDIDPGNALTAAGNLIYFVANDGEHGAELWRSDGSDVGTVMVADLEPGPGPARIRDLVDVDGTLFFTRRIGTSGSDFDLWRSDGTAAGTVPVMEFGAGSNSNISSLVTAGGALYFGAATNNDRELWRHDPSTGETVEIEVNPLGGSFPNELTDVDGTLYFRAYVNFDDELYRLEGETPVRVRDIHLTGSSIPQKLTPVTSGGVTTLYFSADDGVSGRELWRSDGTEAGTFRVMDINPDGDGLGLQFFFDGVPDFADVAGTLFFVADDGSGQEVWRSDGTEAGTFVLDVNTIENSFPPRWVVDLDGTACFTARSGEGEFTLADFVLGYDVWTSDGTPAGTRKLDIAPDRTLPSYAVPQRVVGSTLYFIANDKEVLLPFDDGDDVPTDYELWKTDGSRAGTVMVADINPTGSAFERPEPFGFGELDGMLIFRANDGVTGWEPWISDGSAEGTQRLMDIDPDPDPAANGSFPLFFTRVGQNVFFAADDGAAGSELWRTDGTEAGTVLLDIQSGPGTSSPSNLIELGGTLFFSANDGLVGTELWRSDGTAAGTVLVRDIRPGAPHSSLRSFTVVEDALFFSANNDLWTSDGTAAGTLQIVGVSNIGELAALGGVLYFGALGDGAGYELWRHDPAADLTERVTDLNPGGNSFPSDLMAFDGALFFSANAGAAGHGLYKFDPAVGMAELIVQPVVTEDPEIADLIDVAGTLYFTAKAGGPIPKRARRDLWRSDGTAAGTMRLDFGLSISLTPEYLTEVDGSLFFRGAGFYTSTEMYKLIGTPSLSITSPGEGQVIAAGEVLVEGRASDDGQVVSVIVNGVAAALVPTGNPDDPAEVAFSASIQLEPGENEIVALAADDDAHTTKVTTVVVSAPGRPQARPRSSKP